MTITALKGFKDILPDDVAVWQRIETTARDIFHRFGFGEIRLPILEKTELFIRSIGEATDIVEKEMYTFTDRNGASLTMRPEGTASLLRAFIEHGMHVRQPVQRFYTIGPMFRHERPQKGRLRQFHQLSVEALGSAHPRLDAEIIAMASLLLQTLGLSTSLEINSLGCPECRPAYKQALIAFLDRRLDAICPDCQRRSSSNPLRVLDCKSSGCQEQYTTAPSILDHLCSGCQVHFEQVEQGLHHLGIPYTRNPAMVRGLDYYSRTTFELLTRDLGAQSAVGAGGRYDGLLQQLGGPDLPGIGFAVGMERLALLIGDQASQAAAGTDLFLVTLGEAAAELGFAMIHALRVQGLRAAMDHEGRSLKKQMKLADKMNASHTLVLGDDDLVAGFANLKTMASGELTKIELPGDMARCCAVLAEKLQAMA